MSDAAPRQPERGMRAIQSAFDAWNDVACSGLSARFDPSGTHRNTVAFETRDWEHSRTSFAVTAVSYRPDDGEIVEADIEVNEVHYEFDARQSGPSPNAPDLQNTITHEIGHAFGFAHSKHDSATMYGGARPGETSKRTLHSDDVDGLCQVYSRDSFNGECRQEQSLEPDDSAPKAPGSENFGWGGGSEESKMGRAGCSVTGSTRSGKLPVGASLLVFAFFLLVRHGASVGAVRKRGRSGRPPEGSDRR
jgi:hypothetical protein